MTQQTIPAQPPKKRDTALTVWVAIMVIVNLFAAILYLLLTVAVATNSTALTDPLNAATSLPLWAIALFTVLAITSLGSAALLLKMKKLGFYAFLFSNMVLTILDLALGLTTSANLMFMGVSFPVNVFAAGGLLGIGTLYLVLCPKIKMLQ
jgi:hypothetical protein